MARSRLQPAQVVSRWCGLQLNLVSLGRKQPSSNTPCLVVGAARTRRCHNVPLVCVQVASAHARHVRCAFDDSAHCARPLSAPPCFATRARPARSSFSPPPSRRPSLASLVRHARLRHFLAASAPEPRRRRPGRSPDPDRGALTFVGSRPNYSVKLTGGFLRCEAAGETVVRSSV